MGLLSSEISTRKMVPVCRQLATAYDAGIPIVRALDLVRDQSRDPQIRDVLGAIRDRVVAGETLGDAARAERRHLPPLFIELLATGETGGHLDHMLKDLADYYEDRLTMRRQVAQMMTLPVLYVIVAWFLGTFSLGLISRINLDARKPFSFAEYINHYVQLQMFTLVVVAVLIAAAVLLGRAGLLSRITSSMARLVWPFNMISRKFALARFFRSFALLVGAGVDIKSCIRRAAAASNNPYIERDVLRAVPRVGDGMTLSESFRVARTLTPVARQMLEVGEQSGKLDTALHKVSEYHMEEARQAAHYAARIGGVAVLLAVGGLVGYIVISFWMRYFALLNSI